MYSDQSIPVINVEELVLNTAGKLKVAQEIGAACRDYGFFYVSGHGVSEALQEKVERLSREFFAQPMDKKMKIRIELSGEARRGFVPVGNEVTSGKVDMKEGIYFGVDFPTTHPLVVAGLPLHGPNVFPDEDMPEYRHVVTEYLDALSKLGHKLVEGIALSLDLEGTYFYDRYMKDDSFVNSIVYNYPKQTEEVPNGHYGAGEHTDYGFLTILKQDTLGGLEVKSRSKWIQATPIPGTFVCNIGDMLDRMTGGLYRSTPHRVKCPTVRDRLSFPFFFDPAYNAEVRVIEGLDVNKLRGDDYEERWDKSSVHKLTGTYGEYVALKLGRALPNLAKQVFQ